MGGTAGADIEGLASGDGRSETMRDAGTLGLLMDQCCALDIKHGGLENKSSSRVCYSMNN